MDRDPLDIIAESYRISAQTQLLLARTQTFVLILVGLSLIGTGWLVWQHLITGHQMAAQTQALTEMLRLMLERLGQR